MNNLKTTRYRNYISLLTVLFTKREDVRMYLNLLLTLVAIALFGWLAIRPTILTIIELRRHIMSQQNTLTLLEQKAKQLQQAQQELRTLQGSIDQINQAIPNQANPYTMARQIEALTSQKQVVLLDLSVGKITLVGKTKTTEVKTTDVALPQGIQAYPISMVLEGDPENILNFLQTLSALRQPLIAETISLVGKPPGSATKLVLSINGYVPFEQQ